MAYLPLTDRFCHGDILLTRSKRISSKGIRAATHGQYSHAMICTSPPTMIEAVPGCVRNLTLSRCYVDNLDNVRVLRYPDPSVAKEAGREASLWLDTPYSILAAFCAVKSMPNRQPDGGIFCSRLVAEAFRAAGGKFLDAHPTDKITPAMIEVAQNLKDITKTLFEPSPEGYNLRDLSALDGDVLPWKVDELSEKRRMCAEKVVPYLRQYEDAYPDRRKVTPTFMRIIELLVSASMGVRAVEKTELDCLTSIDEALYSAIQQTGLGKSYSKLIEVQNEMNRDIIADSFQSAPKFDLVSIQQSISNSGRLDERERDAKILTDIAAKFGFHGLKEYSELELEIVESLRQTLEASKEVVARRCGR